MQRLPASGPKRTPRRSYYPHRASARLAVLARRAEALSDYLQIAGRPAEALAAEHLAEQARHVGRLLDHSCGVCPR